MSEAMRKMRSRLGENLNAALGEDSTVASVVGNPLVDILLEKLIDLAVKLIDNCLNNNSLEKVASFILGADAVERMAVTNAIRRSKDIEKAYKSACRESLLKTMREAPEDEVKAVVSEVKEKKVDWSMFD